MPPAILRRRSIRVALVAVALATVPGTARRAVTQVIDACAWEGDSWGVGSAPLCDPFTECWTDRYACTISARTRFLAQSFQATCPDCQPVIIDPNRFLRSITARPAVAPASGDPVGSLERVSVAPGGLNADAGSLAPALTDDGRYVVFDSAATNLVPGDTNGRRDVYMFDRTLQQTERVSVTSAGVQGNSDSIAGSVSADGRFIAFLSIATNLVAGDTNGVGDVFVRDRLNGTTERINLGPGNIQATGVSVRWGTAAGSWPVSRTDGFATFHYVNIAADNSETAISADGRYVAFVSDATNLVQSDLNQLPDVFVRDRQSETTELVSVTNAGAQLVATATGVQQSTRPRVAISSTGQFVAFETAMPQCPATPTTIPTYTRDRQAGQTLR
jgi:hypothetical protein